MVYGIDSAGSDGYRNIFDIYVQPSGLLEATGLCTWDTWTCADLREATPDEAETQTLRAAGFVTRYVGQDTSADELNDEGTAA